MTLKKVARTITISLTLLVTAAAAFAQNEPAKPAEANYEVVLNVLIAGGQTGEAPPSSLSAVSRQIRSEFGFSNLRLINTYLGRVANRGNIEYKGVSNAYAPESMPGFPSFLDWKMMGLRNTQNAAGQPAYQLHGFRFGARVPVRAGTFQDAKVPVPINYENIGLTVDLLSVRENIPTLIGTLTQPRTDGTLFLVLTVRNADK